LEILIRDIRLALVIPVQNHLEFLQQCLSLLSNQCFPRKDWEVLICDDGSTEDIRSVVVSFERVLNIRLLHQQAKGPAAARNLGIRGSTSPVIIFLDSDVLPDQALVKHLMNALDKNPEWMGAEAKLLAIGGKESPLWDAPICRDGKRFHTAAIAYRRKALIEAGGFDEAFKLSACEDVDLAARILKQGPVGFVPEAVVYHPQRRVTMSTHWRWRKFWRYEMILAKRYGFLAFPGYPAGPFPRLRVALAAIITLPAGRFIEGIKYIKCNPSDGLLACLYASFDVFFGVWVLPSILFSRVPPQRNYL
jgi:glycosyltransferase involved in cell wall biosynthesis